MADLVQCQPRLSRRGASPCAARCASFWCSTSAGELYGVELTRIREILSPPPITPVPRCSPLGAGRLQRARPAGDRRDLRRRWAVRAPAGRRARILLVAGRVRRDGRAAGGRGQAGGPAFGRRNRAAASGAGQRCLRARHRHRAVRRHVPRLARPVEHRELLRFRMERRTAHRPDPTKRPRRLRRRRRRRTPCRSTTCARSSTRCPSRSCRTRRTPSPASPITAARWCRLSTCECGSGCRREPAPGARSGF